MLESQWNLQNILTLYNLTFVFYLDFKKVKRLGTPQFMV